VFIPCLPEAIEAFQYQYKIVEGFNPEFDSKLSDCTSSLYSQFYNAAALLGPVIGGVMYDVFNFEHTMDCNMIFELFLAVLFIYYNCGRDVYPKDKNLRETVQKLKEIGDKSKKSENHEERTID